MKKWKLIAPLSLAAAGAAAVGIVMLLKQEKTPDAAPATKAAAPKKNLKTGSYSFISGFKDAATVELTLDYDSDIFSFAVIAEEFPSYTSDSHVAVLYGPDFDMQIEYAGYYHGEDFTAHSKHLSEKFKGFDSVVYGENTGVKYIDGDNVCLCFPVDEHSNVLITILKAKDNDADFTTLPDHPDVIALLDSMRIQIRH